MPISVLPNDIGIGSRHRVESQLAVVLGRLGVDYSPPALGVDRILVRDAWLRAVQASEAVGARGLLEHAFSDGARTLDLIVGFARQVVAPAERVKRLASMVLRDDLALEVDAVAAVSGA